MSEHQFEPNGDHGGEYGAGRAGSPLRSLIAALRHRWWAVLTVFVVVVAVSTWRTGRQTRLYQATAVIQVKSEESALGTTLAAPQYPDWRIDPIQSEMEIIKSQEVAERVADSLGLRLRITRPAKLLRSQLLGTMPVAVTPSTDYAVLALRLDATTYSLLSDGKVLSTAPYGTPVIGAGVSLTVPRRPDMAERDVELQVIPLAAAGGAVRGGIVTKGRPQTNVVEITYTGDDPLTVREIANAIALQYEKFSSESQRKRSLKNIEEYARALDATKIRLDSAQQRLQDFKEHAQIGNVSAQQTALAQQISGFQSDREKLEIERGVYLRLIGSADPSDTSTTALRNLSGTDALKNASISQLYGRWFDLAAKRDSLLTMGGRSPSNGDVVWTDTLIAKTKRELRDASARYVQSLESTIKSFDARIDTLKKEMEKYPSLEAQEAKLVADVTTLQKMYDQLQSAYQTARITGSSGGSGVRLVDAAQAPGAPISPNRRRALMTAIVLGLMLGAGAALVIENLDDSVKSPDQIRDELGLPVLGTIPGIKSVGGRGADHGTRLIAAIDPRAPVAEAYRSLRTNLAFARAHEALRTIVLTSPGPADGKSTTVANLAITFAQQGQRTLLIDGDLRRAVLDKLFDVPRAPGLTDVLVGKSTLEDVIHPSAVENLSVLGSGQFPPNPAELLGSSAMRNTLRLASERFDIVLIDSPPLLAVTDAAVLSTMADAAILVVRMGSTARTAVHRAVGQLQAVHGRLVGAVMNDVNFRDGGYGGYGYYYYYYYYGHDGHRNGKHGVIDRVRRWTGLIGSGRES